MYVKRTQPFRIGIYTVGAPNYTAQHPFEVKILKCKRIQFKRYTLYSAFYFANERQLFRELKELANHMRASTGYKTVTVWKVSASYTGSVSKRIESTSPRPIKVYVTFTTNCDLFSSQNGQTLRIPDRQHNMTRKCITETGVRMCSQ